MLVLSTRPNSLANAMLAMSATLFSLIGSGCLPGPKTNANLPAASTPLESAWVELIAVQDEQFNKLAAAHNASQAEALASSAIEYQKKRHAVLKKIADLGGEKPPFGVPEKYRTAYKESEDRLYARDNVVSQMISEDKRLQFNDQVQQAIAGLEDPFAQPAAARGPAAAGTVTVTLVNNKSLQGEAHQRMIGMLRDLAGASQAEPVIESDGTYKLVLSPVNDIAQFASKIRFGDISNRDDYARSFTLTIDPVRFQAAVSAGGPAASPVPGQPGFGQPGFGGPGPRGPGPSGFAQQGQPGGPGFSPAGGAGGSREAQVNQQKSRFFMQHGGAEQGATIVLQGNAAGAKSAEIQDQIKSATGANATMMIQVGREQRLLLVAPIADFSTLAEKITFGTVTAQDAVKREITVEVTP
jgi:hypothetical protein